MNRGTRKMTGLMLVAMLAACSPSQPSSEAGAEEPAQSMAEPPAAAESSEPAPTPAEPMPDATSGDMVAYACDDGSGLTVTYDEYTALVKLPTGSTMLSRAESAPDGSDEAYLGEELSLYRDGNLVRLQVAGKTSVCTRSAAS